MYERGTEVCWEWGAGTAHGKVTETFTSRTEKTIKGNSVVRNADSKNPAYLIEQSDGDVVLKSHSEINES